MAYSNWIAYPLLIILGWFGAHHFYLKRDRHAFLWIWTLGGGCGVGCLLDLFWLKDFVNLANAVEASRDPQAIFESRSPKLSVMRLFGEVAFSLFLGALAIAAFPSEFLSYPILCAPVMAMAVAVGVHTVANVGYERCRLGFCFIGALLPTLVVIYKLYYGLSYEIQNSLFCSCLASTLVGNWKGREGYSTPVKHNGVCVRILQLAVANVVMMSLFTGAVYFNGSITNKHGETIRIRDAVQNILNSPAWAECKVIAVKLWSHFWSGGFDDFRHHLSIALDPDGEENAYKMLNLESGASEKEIRAQYKKLAKQYHPDKLRLKSETEQKEAEATWIKITQAYELLSSMKSRRLRKNEL